MKTFDWLSRRVRTAACLVLWGAISMGGSLGSFAGDAPLDSGDANATNQVQISYSKQIEPIFRTHCQGCHQPAKAQGEYVMTEFDRLVQAGETGEIPIVPGSIEESHLLLQIASVNGQAAMPKNGDPLSQADVDLIREWIRQGAHDDSVSSRSQYDSENPPRYTRPPVVTAVSYSPNGKWLASSGFQEVLIIDTENWKTTKRLVGLSERIESLSFSPDSKRLAVTGGSPGRVGEVQVWDVDSETLLLSHQSTYDTLYGGSFSPDGKLIAFGATDNVVRAIEAETGKQVLHQGAHEDWIRACVFSPDGKHLVSAGRDRTVKLTEVATERFVDNITSITPGALRGGINSLAMHPERNEVLVGGADGIPKVYRLFRETQRRIGDDANLIRRFPATAGRIFSVAISHDGSRLAVASTLDGRSKVVVYPYDFDGELPKDVKDIMAKRVAERKPDQRQLIEDYINDISDPLLELELGDTSLFALTFSPDGETLAVGGNDGLLRLIQVESGQVFQSFSPVELEGNEAIAADVATAWKSAHGMPPNTDSLPNREDEEARLPHAELIGLQIAPNRIELASITDYVQLVVSAEYATGQVCDVTRLSRISETSPGSDAHHIEVDQFGLVRPVAAGQSHLQIQFGGLSTQVAVRVSDTNPNLHPDFTRDVNPILSRLGCNAGTCHGAQKGKNGFKLSLRGYDPYEDIRALSDDLSARRLNTAAPDASLMLLKPIGAVPHEGGVLLTPDSTHYAILKSWIGDGARLTPETRKVARIELAPKQPVIETEQSWQQFRVVAHFHDGSQRDVTQEAFIESGDGEICKSFPAGRVQALRRGEAPILARYEGAYAAATVTVMGDRSDFVWQASQGNSTIDDLVSAKWQRMKILPSDVCKDHEFLRRIRLDLTGLPPASEELKEFLSDPRPSRIKRQAKIEALIGSGDYVDHWTNKWADLLQVNSKFLGKDGAKAFREWIRKAVDQNQPYDQFARDVLTASGSNKQNPAASYYKILREPDLMMENTTHLFMAVRFNCNKCHDHPFERWTQDQYYELAAFFAQTSLKKDPESGNQRIGGTAVEGAKPLYEEVYDNSDGEMSHVRTGNVVEPEFPFDCDFDAPEGASRRQQLAYWITSPDNPYFARSYVNRLWGYLTGTGLMEPIDDIRAGNPPTNPDLLDHLTQEFIGSGFDTEHVIRLICNSRTYQLSVASNAWNDDDAINYSHAKARRLPAEVLYDAVYKVTGAVSAIPGVQPGTRAAALPDVAVQLPDGFLNNLGRPVRESACECERSQDLQLGPVMALVSGPTVGKAISDPKCALPALAGTELTDAEIVREIYRRVLSREASDEEVETILQTAGQMDLDHEKLVHLLEEKEKWWSATRADLESQRLAKLAAVRESVEARKVEIAPERARMEKERAAKQLAAEKALKEFTQGKVALANTYLKGNPTTPHWFPLAPTELSASNKARLTAQSDRSIVATDQSGKGYYTLSYTTPLTGISGFRLEALPQVGIPGGGPGLPANGNFVVTEIEVTATSLDDAKQKQAVRISSGIADFSQDGFDPKQVFDGRANDQRGWAVHPRGNTVHWANFQFEKPVGSPGGTKLTFKISQYHNAEAHRLAHFRISVTTDSGEIGLGLPESFAALQSIPEKQRNESDLAGLLGYLEKSDNQWQKMRSAVADAKKPLPADETLVALQAQAKQLEMETPEDARLVQLRSDFKASQAQLENRRLTLAQDLTWALINSPAFLFNH